MKPEITQQVTDLYQQNQLTNAERDRALAHFGADRSFKIHWMNCLKVLGLAQCLAAVIFFFAYNWAALGTWIKFAVLQGPILILLGILYARFDDLPLRRLCLLIATLLVGVLLAQVGVIYQTPAEAYELFLVWALFTLGWVLIAQSLPLWLIWILIVQIGVSLWWNTVMLTNNSNSLFLGLAIISGLFLVLREYIVSHIGILKPIYGRWILVGALACQLFMSGLPTLMELTGSDVLTHISIIQFVFTLLSYFTLIYIYRFVLTDIVSFSCVQLSFSTLLLVFFWFEWQTVFATFLLALALLFYQIKTISHMKATQDAK